jgi:hypothetical protein
MWLERAATWSSAATQTSFKPFRAWPSSYSESNRRYGRPPNEPLKQSAAPRRDPPAALSPG